jgi:hypothetical protein
MTPQKQKRGQSQHEQAAALSPDRLSSAAQEKEEERKRRDFVRAKPKPKTAKNSKRVAELQY